uniref:Uncharacterized protein n=1 Tax=viral metagenome TaxID=1070528 RepID=A0A6C0BMC0_9ZZZZ
MHTPRTNRDRFMHPIDLDLINLSLRAATHR